MPEQAYKSHAAWDPRFHFVVMPIFLINLILAITYTIRQWPMHSRSHLWWIVMAFALFLFALTMRGWGAKNQDRIIRLEERLRMAALLPPGELAAAQSLTTRQLIALRFASDAELPALVHRTLTDKLEPKQIKAAITTWRADFHRI